MNSEGPCAPGSQAEKKEEEGKNDTGRLSFGEQGPQLNFHRELLYLKLYIENNGRCRISSPDPYRDQAFFLHAYLYTQVLGDLHHLLARRPANIL